MGSYIPPQQHIDLTRAVLRSVVADHYARDNDPHGDAEAEHSAEQVAIAARALAHAVDGMDCWPVGWAERTKAKPAADTTTFEPHTVIVTRGKAPDPDSPLDTPCSYYVPWTGLQYVIKHTAACDALAYYVRCWFDGAPPAEMDHWPSEVGVYEVTYRPYIVTADGVTRIMHFERTGNAPADTHYGASPYHAGTTTHLGEQSNCPAPDCMDAEYEAVHEETTAGILNEVAAERARQIEKWGEQHHRDGTGLPTQRQSAERAKAMTDYLAETGQSSWNYILEEEVFEAYSEKDPGSLRTELIQVAAVAVAWIEDIDSRATPTEPKQCGDCAGYGVPMGSTAAVCTACDGAGVITPERAALLRAVSGKIEG